MDQADVLSIKTKMLHKMGAALAPDAREEAHAAVSFPLKVAALRMVAADLLAPGWAQRLITEGLDPELPILWQAEGLLNYLTAEGIQAMLRDAAKVGATSKQLGLQHLGRSVAVMVVECAKGRFEV